MNIKLFIYCQAIPGQSGIGEVVGFTDDYAAVLQWCEGGSGRVYFPIEGELKASAPASDIARKTAGVLVDELITTDIKCFMAQETIMKTRRYPADDGREAVAVRAIAAASEQAQTLNRRRNELIRAIDDSVGQAAASPTGKTY